MVWSNNTQPVRKIPVRVVEDEDIPVSPADAPSEDEVGEPSLSNIGEIGSPLVGRPDWQSRALHLQADMDNFRRRQTRRANEAIAAERERLLRLTLPVADNLVRALSQDGHGDESLQQGVELTYRELMRFLKAEGVTRIETVGQPFNPEWHEAVATVAANVEAGSVVEELESGYLLMGRLLRPARVVVAV